ncbi:MULTISPECIES: hypothetical protein [unclassified Ruegeria]|uniref:hypothetical protein n=1 Tax=unclassified Ruegeria TaxID=2625375 RepID=UPI001488130A|nr:MULTISPECIES: hypothetical protein [unclassified Ruegeria]
MDLEEQVNRIVALIKPSKVKDTRQLIAIAGPPASGKSTLAEKVRQRLEQNGISCGLVPMDGFHLDNDTLSNRGLLARKGAPETFDTQGFNDLLSRALREDAVAVPLFDRSRDCVVQNAARIDASQRHVVVEGNYLFLKDPAWRPLTQHWSLSVFIEPKLDLLKERLINRWLDHGYHPNQALEKATENDLVNARLVLEQSDRSVVDLIL